LLNTPFRRDCALAAAVSLVFAALLLLLPGEAEPGGYAPQRPSIIVIGLLTAQAAALCFRRIRPVGCVAVVIALQIVLAAAARPGEGVRGAALAIAVYTCGTLMPERRSLTIAGIAAFAEIAGHVALNAAGSESTVSRIAGQAVLAVLIYVGAALLGRSMTIRRRYTEIVELRAAEAAENLRVRTEAALTAERSRMARELHDVAAHHLTALIVQATVVERTLDRDPDTARRSAATIRSEGKSALRNLRLVVEALRETPGGGAPAPGLDMIGQLVAGHADPSRRPRLIVSGEPGELSEAADLTFYRVTQEALSNARDHAPGAEVTVRIDHRGDGSVLEVRNGPVADRNAPGDRGHRGFGLLGMRERAGLIGADLAAGPTSDGGWSVTLTVPRTGADA
jgi:signal transduction histidine kinase